MARMRSLKLSLSHWLESPRWQDHLADIALLDPRSVVGPLLALLPRGGEPAARAAVAAGMAVARLAEQEPEAARVILRRLMWHMNEESGNIGWGIPETFAEILARSPRLTREFHKILLSYIVDTGRDDNYCDNGPLRRSCFWGVGRFAQARPDLCAPVTPHLIKGLLDEDIPCRGMAAWALGQMPPCLDAAPALRRLAASGETTPCVVFDGVTLRERTVADWAAQALRRSV